MAVTGSVVRIGEDRLLQVNGKPFFPIGARHIPEGADHSLLKAVGFNCRRWMAFGGDKMARDRREVPSDLDGLLFYPYLYDRADFAGDAAEVAARKQELTALIEEVRDHPALLCYEQRNEPASTFRDYATPQSPPEGMIEGSRVVRELDPHHPIRVGHITHNLVSTLRRYNAAVDIVGCNPYVVSPPGLRQHIAWRPDGLFFDSPNQTLSAVGDFTSKMMRVAEGRPVWMQLQAMANENWHSVDHTPEQRGTCLYEHQRLYPNRWQMRFMFFSAVIRGATAVEWAVYRLSIDEPAWLDVKRVIGEISALHDVLAAPVWKGCLEMEYKELGFSDWTGVETLVKLHQGRPWILSANTQFDPMEATISSLPSGIDKKLMVFGEDREVNVSNGQFTDYFKPYEVHIYGPA